MPDPKNELAPEQTPGDPPATQPKADGFRFRAPLFGGALNGTGRELSPGTYLGNADYLFSNGDLLGARLKLGTAPEWSIGEYGLNGQFGLRGGHTFKFDAQALPPSDTFKFDGGLQFANGDRLNADWMRTPNGQLYGADSIFKLGKDGSGTANFRVDEPADTAKFETRLKFNPDFSLNADWNRTAAGQVYGADSVFKLGKDGSGTANFRVDEPADTAKFETRLKFNPDFSLNADWNRTAAGQVYGADSVFKLGKDGSGNANFRVDEPADTAKFETRLKFNPDFSLNADWNRTAAGQIYGADSAFKLGKDGSGSAAFRIDEPGGTSMFNTRLKFDENFRLNADLTNTRNGSIYGADAAFKLGKDGSGTAAFRVDEPANSASAKTSLRFGNGNSLNFDLDKTPNGSIYGADGTFGIGGSNGRGSASFRIDEPGQNSSYKLGTSFANGNAFNAQLMSDRLGTTLGLDGKFGFDKGAGSVMLDGKFGPRTDLGASINFKNQNLEYSGQVRANNESGAFKLSEFGAKVSTSGNDRYKFSAEAGYRPENNEYYGKVGLTIQLGGGSRPSRTITRTEVPEYDAGPSVDAAVANYREKQSTLLRPENKALYEQAVAGVETLNAGGAKLPVSETAASVVVLAKQNGMQSIQYVALGNPTSEGRQNLFIGDGDPSSPTARKAFIDKNEAATAPMQDSLRKMAETPLQPGNSQFPVEPQTSTVPKRGSM